MGCNCSSKRKNRRGSVREKAKYRKSDNGSDSKLGLLKEMWESAKKNTNEQA